MSCPAPDRVLDYLARRLDTHERDEVDAHVDGCSACRELLADLARTSSDDVITFAPANDPTRIGRYELRGRLGDGGMGTVYAGHDPQLDRPVAIKLIHPELHLGVERLVREGRALAKLAHPNVVAIYDAGSDGDRAYIAMELVEGTTLAAWLTKPRSTREILERFVAAGRGIAAAHRAGIVHRDVKPENVLIDRAGHVKVADFGLAADEQIASRMTRPGSVLGTPMYMAPEQRRGEPPQAASDQYSFCAALATALEERRLPASIARALARGKAPSPTDRFASFDELVAAIDPVRCARRIRTIAGGVIAGISVAAVIVVIATRGPDRFASACARARAPTYGAVDRARALATGSARVDAALGIYATSLERAGAKLCEQRPDSAASHEAFELATACLADRRTAFASLTGTQPSVARVHELPPVEDCENPASLAAEHAARATPTGLVRRSALAEAIGASTAALATGDYHGAATDARTAIVLGRGFGGVLLAKALLTYAQVAGPVEGFPAVEATMREAAALAEAGHADALRAYALTLLAASLAREPGREKETLTLQPIVAAAISSAGKQQSLDPMLDQAVGTAQMRLGHDEAALASFSAALAAARAALPPDDPRLPEYIYPVGVALGMMRRDAEAAKYHAEAYAVASKIWGADHPNAVRFEINLAVKHGALNDCTTALREAAHARKFLTGVLPPSSAEHLLIDELMGSCHWMRHELDAALAEYEIRQSALRAAGAEHTVEMAAAWVDVGDVELDRKHTGDALGDYARAVALYEELVGVADPRLALPLTRLGEAELELGHDDRAVVALERALQLYASAAPVVAADARFPLARALWRDPGSRGRATALLAEARAAFANGGAQFAPRVAEIDAWSHAHR